jgi:hypothetical protein
VPFLAATGIVIVCGPEELNYQRRRFSVPRGNYRLVAAQRIIGDEHEAVDLFFEALSMPLERSTILISDHGLNPPNPLVECCDAASER